MISDVSAYKVTIYVVSLMVVLHSGQPERRSARGQQCTCGSRSVFLLMRLNALGASAPAGSVREVQSAAVLYRRKQAQVYRPPII